MRSNNDSFSRTDYRRDTNDVYSERFEKPERQKNNERNGSNFNENIGRESNNERSTSNGSILNKENSTSNFFKESRVKPGNPIWFETGHVPIKFDVKIDIPIIEKSPEDKIIIEPKIRVNPSPYHGSDSNSNRNSINDKDKLENVKEVLSDIACVSSFAGTALLPFSSIPSVAIVRGILEVGAIASKVASKEIDGVSILMNSIDKNKTFDIFETAKFVGEIAIEYVTYKHKLTDLTKLDDSICTIAVLMKLHSYNLKKLE